ncbi:trypsin-like [Wyeomyia smithii]|uniref:trypsin-like n=1 Tax=Wyeomyia smithii TaxID=174621 RepID=UPI002467EC5F|nr:trypsin-like [Wyeomyia smithii]
MADTRGRWLIAVLLLQVVAAQTEPSPLIIGGSPAALGAFPAHVGIHIGQPQTLFCGGTILNTNHILTAGSCVLDGQNMLRGAAQFAFRSGVVIIDANAPSVGIDRVFVHPLYNPFTFENDIAVLRVFGTINFPQVATPNVAPAELQDRIVPENSACQVVGWNWQPNVANQALQQLGVLVHPRVACNNLFNGMIQNSMLCVQPTVQTQALCLPNRGGGLYCNGRLTGIVSFGLGCGANTTETATVVTQVRYYQQWILQQFVRNDNPQAGTTPMPGIGGGSASLLVSAAAILFATIMMLVMR